VATLSFRSSRAENGFIYWPICSITIAILFWYSR